MPTEYQAWVTKQFLPLTRASFVFNTLHVVAMLLKAYVHMQLQQDAPWLICLLFFYGTALLVLSISPAHSEVGRAQHKNRKSCCTTTAISNAPVSLRNPLTCLMFIWELCSMSCKEKPPYATHTCLIDSIS